MVNLLAVLVSGIIATLIGALWYSPLLFGKQWMKLMKITEKDIKNAKKKSMIKLYIINFVSTLVMIYVLGYLFDVANVLDVTSGIMLSIVVWLGFVATLSLNSVLWENKPVKLYIINILYPLVSLVVTGIILSVWR